MFSGPFIPQEVYLILVGAVLFFCFFCFDAILSVCEQLWGFYFTFDAIYDNMMCKRHFRFLRAGCNAQPPLLPRPVAFSFDKGALRRVTCAVPGLAKVGREREGGRVGRRRRYKKRGASGKNRGGIKCETHPLHCTFRYFWCMF